MGTDRIQTGVRLYGPLLKTLKALAEYLDLSLSDLMEGMLLHGLENKAPFDPDHLQVIEKLKEVYGCEWSAKDSHMFPDEAET